MPVMHAILIVGFILAGTACVITSNVIVYQILTEVNSRRSPVQSFSFIFVNVRAFKITSEHARLYPESQKWKLMYVWAGIGFALFLTVVFYFS